MAASPSTGSVAPWDRPPAGEGATPPTSGPREPEYDRDAYESLLSVFSAYGLESLAEQIKKMLIEGVKPDTIALRLAETDEYKKRFAGNELIKEALRNGTAAPGVRVLSPGEYLQQEKQYRDVMSYYGLPAGFYDSPDDFAGWIGNGVSVLEIQDRARLAKEAVNNSSQEFKDALRQYYGLTDGEMAAFFLDQGRALPLLENRVAAAQIGGAAMTQGLSVAQERAEALAEFGVTKDQARQGYAAIGSMLPDAQKLAQIDNVQYSQADAEDEVFRQDAGAARKRRKLADRETSRFGGASGVGKSSLSQSGDY